MSLASASIPDSPFSPAADTVKTPESVDHVLHEIRQAGEHHTAIFPSGGQTSFDFGGNRARAGISLSSLKLNRVIDYPADDMTITVEAGLTLGELQTILAGQNQYLPIDPPQADKATIGGIMATGWTGPRRHQAMRPRDQVIGLAFVSGRGDLVRGGGKVVKNVAGYDFPKLLTGSAGSLGMITELTFKVRPRPESTALAIVQINDAKDLADYLTRLNSSATRPTAIELLNTKAAAGLVNQTGMKPANYSVVLFFDESAKAVAWQADQCKAEIPGNAEIHILKDDAAIPLQSGLTERLAGLGQPLVPRVVVAPSTLWQLAQSLSGSHWSLQAHAGQGIATCFHESASDLTEVTEDYRRLSQVVKGLGGTVTLPVCRNDWKDTLPVWGEKRPDWDLMAGIKRALDPKFIMNPGILLDLK
ncbi:MAG: FAD-binding oxidoreductase [bacterium]